MAKTATQAMNYELVKPRKASEPYTGRVRVPKSKTHKFTRRLRKKLSAVFNYHRIAQAVAACTLLALTFVGALEITAPMGYTVSFFFSVVVVFLLIDTAWRRN